MHIDAFELPKFQRPGHWSHGDRSQRHRTRRAGRVKVIGVIDDHTRLAYCEIHTAENAITVSATLRRAAAWMREQGCGPVQAVMSDNARCYATRAGQIIVDGKAHRCDQLPLPSDVGEAIVEHLMHRGRRRGQRHVFLTVHAPFGRLSRAG